VGLSGQHLGFATPHHLQGGSDTARRQYPFRGHQPATRQPFIHLQNRLLRARPVCRPGRQEGFIKNHKTFLHSDRTSCHTFEANHFRLFLHSAAYVLLQTLAEMGLRGTKWTNAQYNTLQNRLLKVACLRRMLGRQAGRVCEMKTKITFHLPTAFPLKHLYAKILYNLASSVP
jgi:hypothetical protein